MERGEFTDTVIVAELQPRHFALELEILRFASDQRVGMDMVAHAHPRVIFDDGVGVDAATIPDDDMLFDDRIGAISTSLPICALACTIAVGWTC